ncbi:TPA: prephenate dehydratase [bacterium]|nr:prephenate dehydratase [bacterium]
MELEKLRKEIDSIDDRLLKLLEQRISIAKKIGLLKKERNISVLHADRENQILERLIRKSKIIPKGILSTIYREIFSLSLKFQKEPVIAYLGPCGTFTHQASQARFGSEASFIEETELSDIFHDVEKDRADYGVVPIENSIEGVVTHALDMFIDSNLHICDEIFLDISHSLLSLENSIEDIKKIYSHPQVFAQCRKWITKNIPKDVELIETSSTASAAKKASCERNASAIASSWAGPLYGLNILEEGIEDFVSNTTRFLVIGKEYGQQTGNDKTSIMFSVKDRIGVLYDMLAPFAKAGINLTKIESRPSRLHPWEYIFFLDFEGHIDEERVKSALSLLEELCVHLKILGSYPKGSNSW